MKISSENNALILKGAISEDFPPFTGKKVDCKVENDSDGANR